MIYSSKRSSSTRLFVLLCASAALLTVVTQQTWAVGPRDAARSALAPLESALASASRQYDRITSVFGDVSSLRAENERLRAADEALRQEVVQLNAQAKENATLRQDLNFERSYGHQMVAAQVIGRGPDNLSRTITIDRGTADGVHAGMVVATSSGLLGRIGEAGPHVAIVQTLEDPQSRVNVYLSKSGLNGVVSGASGSLRLAVEHPLGTSASVGEWALTSGLGGGYPRGLVIGEIASVTRSDAAPTDQAQLAWVNDPNRLDLVLVITDFIPA